VGRLYPHPNDRLTARSGGDGFGGGVLATGSSSGGDGGGGDVLKHWESN
jgi:hypothetical protein